MKCGLLLCIEEIGDDEGGAADVDYVGWIGGGCGGCGGGFYGVICAGDSQAVGFAFFSEDVCLHRAWNRSLCDIICCIAG